MDNAQKAIMIGVGLFITIIVIAAVMLITGIGQDLLNSGTQKASSISDNLQAQLTSQYDGTTMSGSQVISAVKSNYKTEGLAVVVNNGKGDKNYGKVGSGSLSLNNSNKRYETSGTLTSNYTPDKVGLLSDTTTDGAKYYVSPSVQYKADLIYISGSDAIVGIYFHK